SLRVTPAHRLPLTALRPLLRYHLERLNPLVPPALLVAHRQLQHVVARLEPIQLQAPVRRLHSRRRLRIELQAERGAAPTEHLPEEPAAPAVLSHHPPNVVGT